MAAGAYSDVAILGLTYAEDAANLYPDSEPDIAEIVSNDDDQTSRSTFDPQVECWCAQEDFIIFSEFSEVQGPLPLLTIPSHIQDDNQFDMNTFILKIMSVDYQANPSGHFILSDDTQVLQLSVVANLHTYAHYFTLHDIHARGFVRPMCLAYVTRDKNKLQHQFSTLRENFLKVTQLMKFNNRQGFFEDLVNNLHKLKIRQDKYFEWKRQEEEGEALAADDHEMLMTTEIDQLVQQYTEYKHLLHIVEPTIGDTELKQLISTWESTFKLSVLQEARQFIKKLANQSVTLLSPGHTKPIRPVMAISPWGCLAALNKLLNIRQIFGKCSLEVKFNVFQTSFTSVSDCKSEIDHDSPTEALLCKEYLQVIHNLTYPKEWGGDESMDATVASQEDLDYLEAHFLSSGNECSSSYHSAPSSVPELVAPSNHSSSHTSCQLETSDSSEQSFCDVTEELVDWSGSSGDEDEKEQDLEWSGCLWKDADMSAPNNKPGSNILQFFHTYSQAAQHVLYSILIGRTVLLSCSRNEQSKARRISKALLPLFPGKETVQVLKWHQGIIVPAHIEKYKVISMCVPERLSVHDMISSKDKNSVTILELGSKQLFGPAYSGKLLSQLDPACVSMLPSDQTLLLLLKSVFIELDSQSFLCHTIGPDQMMKELGLQGCDLAIVKYLASISTFEPDDDEENNM